MRTLLEYARQEIKRLGLGTDQTTWPAIVAIATHTGLYLTDGQSFYVHCESESKVSDELQAILEERDGLGGEE